jgi:sortase A
MFRRKNPEDLSVEELRRLLIEKRRSSRKDRLERFRQTGRVVNLVPDSDTARLQDLRARAGEEEEEKPARMAPRSRGRRFFDGLLLLVEISAVLILGFVLFNGFELIRELNAEVAGALEQPTLTPTPLLIAAVLPSGHTPPTSPGGARPNDAEIPEHLRPLVQSMANIPLPTPSPEQAIRIQIPAIDVDAPIVQGDGWEQLKKGVGQHIGTAVPGQNGNMVLSAHNDIFGEIFRFLDQLKPGDQIIVYTNQRSYTYVVTTTKIVEPTQVEVMAPTVDPTATLISCWPYLIDDQRVVVQAALQDG